MLTIVFLILELVMTIAGLKALFTGSLPAGLFRALFGRGDYQTDERTARRYGWLLCAPAFTLIAAIILGMVFGEEATNVGSFAHLVAFVLALLFGVRGARKIRAASAGAAQAGASVASK